MLLIERIGNAFALQVTQTTSGPEAARAQGRGLEAGLWHNVTVTSSKMLLSPLLADSSTPRFSGRRGPRLPVLRVGPGLRGRARPAAASRRGRDCELVAGAVPPGRVASRTGPASVDLLICCTLLPGAAHGRTRRATDRAATEPPAGVRGSGSSAGSSGPGHAVGRRRGHTALQWPCLAEMLSSLQVP